MNPRLALPVVPRGSKRQDISLVPTDKPSLPITDLAQTEDPIQQKPPGLEIDLRKVACNANEMGIFVSRLGGRGLQKTYLFVCRIMVVIFSLLMAFTFRFRLFSHTHVPLVLLLLLLGVSHQKFGNSSTILYKEKMKSHPGLKNHDSRVGIPGIPAVKVGQIAMSTLESLSVQPLKTVRISIISYTTKILQV